VSSPSPALRRTIRGTKSTSPSAYCSFCLGAVVASACAVASVRAVASVSTLRCSASTARRFTSASTCSGLGSGRLLDTKGAPLVEATLSHPSTFNAGAVTSTRRPVSPTPLALIMTCSPACNSTTSAVSSPSPILRRTLRGTKSTSPSAYCSFCLGAVVASARAVASVRAVASASTRRCSASTARRLTSACTCSGLGSGRLLDTNGMPLAVATLSHPSTFNAGAVISTRRPVSPTPFALSKTRSPACNAMDSAEFSSSASLRRTLCATKRVSPSVY